MSKQYRYLTVDRKELIGRKSTYLDDTYLDNEKLNEIGSHGWQLVCTTELQLIFKKEVN